MDTSQIRRPSRRKRPMRELPRPAHVARICEWGAESGPSTVSSAGSGTSTVPQRRAGGSGRMPTTPRDVRQRVLPGPMAGQSRQPNL